MIIVLYTYLYIYVLLTFPCESLDEIVPCLKSEISHYQMQVIIMIHGDFNAWTRNKPETLWLTKKGKRSYNSPEDSVKVSLNVIVWQLAALFQIVILTIIPFFMKCISNLITSFFCNCLYFKIFLNPNCVVQFYVFHYSPSQVVCHLLATGSKYCVINIIQLTQNLQEQRATEWTKQVPFNSFTQCTIFIKNVYVWQATGTLTASLITLHPLV